MKARVLGLAVLLALVTVTPNLAQQSAATRRPDVVYVPTPPDVVNAMLKLAKVTSTDVVYDLGSGDGRIVILWRPDSFGGPESCGRTSFG